MLTLNLESVPGDVHTAALNGDLEHLKSLLANGADINAMDKNGRTALYCAVDNQHAGSCEDVVRFIITHPTVTLRTLNAPCFPTGMTPLCWAAANNKRSLVRVLLEESTGSVSVDATNEDLTTPLTHATLHGYTAISQVLLQHGARPDFRNRDNRTPIQEALAHPQILRICENVLRRHRWRSNQTAVTSPIHKTLLNAAGGSLCSISNQYAIVPPLLLPVKVPVSLVNTILAGDIPQLHATLFPDVSENNQSCPLVNLSDDGKGWSLIHYCAVARYPSTAVLDSLYFAGAELSLVTNDGRDWTLLHCLARYARPAPELPEYAQELEDFLSHAIYDLRAPITATDYQGETCLHIAAEHGECMELVEILVQMDAQGSHGLASTKNHRGLTPLQVARPEFRAILGGDEDDHRPASALTIRALKPKSSVMSLSSMQPTSPWRPVHSSTGNDISLQLSRLFEDLTLTSPHIVATSLETFVFEESLDRCRDAMEAIFGHHRTRIADACAQVAKLNRLLAKVEALRDKVVVAAHDQLDKQRLQAFYPPHRRRHRDSEDSQITAVSAESESIILPIDDHPKLKKIASTPDLLSLFSEVAVKPRSSLSHETLPVVPEGSPLSSPESKKSSSKFRRWFKKMTKSSSTIKQRSRSATPSPQASVISLSQSPIEAVVLVEDSADFNLVRVPFVLDLVWSDLSAVYQKVTLAEEHIQKTTHYINKCSRIADRAFQKREVALQHIRDLEEYAEFADLFTCPPSRESLGSVLAQFPYAPSSPNNYPNLASLASVSVPSTPTQVPSTPSHHTPPSSSPCDDEDVTTLRRLLFRKVDGQFTLAQNEIEHCDSWLRTLRDVVQGMKRQAYL